ncbi:hypothetical protein NP493_564g03007 [Ridgeia piscesae]|uniref:Uncharacterized protein n=1 Tax=Ridgeia piscesae TaxID=27915 RepID=A0AAD9NRI3_RIDPI|nr:hypothetical protein NP493_564g03007 [Ridgeia piscesae]
MTSDALMRYDHGTCQHASRDPDLGISGIVSNDEDACILSEDVASELGQMLAQRVAVHEMMKKTVPLLSPDTMNATDKEGNTPL